MDREDIESSLAKKGFVCEDRDHRYYHHKVDGKYTGVKTKISKGSKYKRLDASLLALIKNQLHLDTSQELRDLVECPMSTEQYIQKLIDKKIIEPPVE